MSVRRKSAIAARTPGITARTAGTAASSAGTATRIASAARPRVTVVTGAARGIGLAVARRFLTGAFLGAQAALPLLAGGGARRIVNLSSHSGQRGSRNRAAYVASKGGLDALTRVLAVELAAQGARVNAVAPGPVETPHSRASHSPARRRAWARVVPMGRYARGEEIAAAVHFLASPEAEFITGQVIAVDGGFTAAGLLEGSSTIAPVVRRASRSRCASAAAASG